MKRIDPWLAFLLAVLVAVGVAVLLGGCTQTQERSVRVREGVEAGKPTRWVEREQSESRTQVVDPQAIGAAVAEAIKGALPGADAILAALKPSQDFMVAMNKPRDPDWTNLAAGLGAAATAMGTGYVALKQRERNKHLPKK
jgi:hypothetical protein